MTDLPLSIRREMSGQKSAFDTPWFNSQSNDFFNQLNKSKTSHLVLTAETSDFDEEITTQFREDGFNTAYVALDKGGAEFVKRVHSTGDAFGVGECYGIVAFGDAATVILETHLKPLSPRLVAIIAYYPSTIPSPHTKFPASVKILVHLAGTTVGVTSTSQVLGIQGKRKTVRKRLDPGEGYGGTLNLAYPAYVYEGVEPGFAESDLDEFDALAAGVAFSRTLGVLRRGFRIEGTVEGVRDGWVDASVQKKEAKGKVEGLVRDYAHVIHGPTLTGGVGKADLKRFYGNFFSPFPPSFSTRLLSRTVGTDRVVDELYVTFTHTAAIPWMLPGVPPTGKSVEVVVVSIMCVRGGKLESEHVHWDQASVLAQVGLIDPKIVPGPMKKKGLRVLPVVGVEAARAVKRGSSKLINGLIGEW